MAKESKYGEKTKMVNYRVPESKVTEINQIVKLKLNEYEKNALVSLEVQSSEVSQKNQTVEKKSNPADDTMEIVIEHKPPEWATKHKHVIKSTAAEFEVKKIEPQVVESYDAEKIQTNTDEPTQYVKPDSKKDKIKALREMEDLIKNGGGPKTSSFTTVKKPIDEIYDCIIVEKGIPAESDRIYYGSNNRIAFWDRDDASVYYANWENKYYRFANSKEFNKFCKDNQIK